MHCPKTIMALTKTTPDTTAGLRSFLPVSPRRSRKQTVITPAKLLDRRYYFFFKRVSIHSRPIGLHGHGCIGALVEGQDPRQQFAPFFVESIMDGEFGEHAPLGAQFRGSQRATGHLQNRGGRSLLGTQQDRLLVFDCARKASICSRCQRRTDRGRREGFGGKSAAPASQHMVDVKTSGVRASGSQSRHRRRSARRQFENGLGLLRFSPGRCIALVIESGGLVGSTPGTDGLIRASRQGDGTEDHSHPGQERSPNDVAEPMGIKI